MKPDLLFKIFWKIKDEIKETEDGFYEFGTYLCPRFGKLGVLIWYLLNSNCKYEIDDTSIEAKMEL